MQRRADSFEIINRWEVEMKRVMNPLILLVGFLVAIKGLLMYTIIEEA